MKPTLEHIHQVNGGAFTAFVYERENFEAPWHYHPEYELTLILEGKGMRYVGNHLGAFAPGDTVLLGASLPHCWRNAAGTGAKSIVIQWQPLALPDIPEFNTIHRMLAMAQRGLRFEKDFQGHFLSIVSAPAPFLRYTRFLELLHVLAQEDHPTLLAGASYQADVSSKTSNRLGLIHQYLSTHYHERITLARMGQLLNMTEGAFSRFFSKSMQKPFFSFLNEYRVNRAGRMLIESDVQAAEIAFACGYESLPFFFKQFKKYKGCSPLVFRNQYRMQSNR